MRGFIYRAQQCEEMAEWFEQEGLSYTADHLRTAASILRHRDQKRIEKEFGPPILTTEDALGERYCVPLHGA